MSSLVLLVSCSAATEGAGPNVDPEPDSGAVEVESPVAAADAGAVEDPDPVEPESPEEVKPMVPSARLFPENESIEDCPNADIPFDFEPRGRLAFDVHDAFWAMWFAERAMFHDDPNTPLELRALGFDRYQVVEWPAKGLQAYVAAGPKAVIVAFRGSTELLDWLGNFDFPLESGREHGLPGRVHRGFVSALEPAFASLEAVIRPFTDRGQPLWITGHSLGGAQAHLAAVLLSREGLELAPIYTFGAPRAGDAEFAFQGERELGAQVYRVVNELDLVPRLPPTGPAAQGASPIVPVFGGAAAGLLRELNYAHLGQMWWFESGVAPGLTGFAALDDTQDVPYWSDAAQGGPIGLLVRSRDQAMRHSPQRYLCRLLAERARP